jgi:hypothetical protein
LKFVDDRDLATRHRHQGGILAARSHTWRALVEHLESFYDRVLTKAGAGNTSESSSH